MQDSRHPALEKLADFQRVLALALGAQLETRTHELSTLQDLSVGLATHSELPELVDDTLGALEQTLAFSSASVWARDGLEPRAPVVLMGWRASELAAPAAGDDLGGMRLSRANLQRYEQIERDGQPVIENRVRQSLLSWLWAFVTDDSRSAGLYRATRAWMAVPLKFRDDVLGVLRVDHHEDDYFSAERARLLTAVGSQAALAMRYSQLHAQEREMAVVAERNRLARELHDAVSQTLFAANMVASTVLRRLEAAAPDSAAAALRHELQTLERLNRGALAEMRLLMFELRPDAMEHAALADLLQHGIEAARCRGELNVQARLDRHDGLPPATRIQVYRIAQEALSNLVRHSRASEALVEWRVHASGVATLRIADDGGANTTVPSRLASDLSPSAVVSPSFSASFSEPAASAMPVTSLRSTCATNRPTPKATTAPIRLGTKPSRRDIIAFTGASSPCRCSASSSAGSANSHTKPWAMLPSIAPKPGFCRRSSSWRALASFNTAARSRRAAIQATSTMPSAAAGPASMPPSPPTSHCRALTHASIPISCITPPPPMAARVDGLLQSAPGARH